MLIALSPARARADERSNVLLLTVAGSADESAGLEAVTRERLERLDVRLEMRRVRSIDPTEMRRPASRAYFARVWITLNARGSARLYLEHAASDRLLVRDVPGDAANPELLREELGHILQAAVEGLKAGEDVGEPRAQVLQQVAPEARPVAGRGEPTAPPAEAPRRPLLRFGARYEVRWLGAGPYLEDGPGAVAALTAAVGVELSGYYRRPLRVERNPVGVRLETISLRALATFAPSSQLRVGAGLGGDFVHVRPLAQAGEGLNFEQATVRKLALGRVQATYGYRAGRFLELQVSAGADLDASGTRYVVQRASGEVSVLSPPPVRPFISLGAVLP